MRRVLVCSALLVLAAWAAPQLQAQGQAPDRRCQGDQLRKRDGSCGRLGKGRGQGQGQGLRKRDGPCGRLGKGRGQGQGQGLRKQDGTGPRGGTPECPRTAAAAPKK